MTVSNADGFVSTLSPGGDRIIYSTYLGGNDNDGIASVAVDSTGRLHVAGWTTSGDFPTTAGTLQPSFAHGTSHLDGSVLPDGFYARLSLDVSALQYGTYLGGSDSDEAASVAVDSAGDAFVTGSTNSVDFPTRNAVQPSHTSTTIYPNRSSDAWLARFSGWDAIFSTYVAEVLNRIMRTPWLSSAATCTSGARRAPPIFPEPPRPALTATHSFR
jgi:hypothetical protein